MVSIESSHNSRELEDFAASGQIKHLGTEDLSTHPEITHLGTPQFGHDEINEELATELMQVGKADDVQEAGSITTRSSHEKTTNSAVKRALRRLQVVPRMLLAAQEVTDAQVLGHIERMRRCQYVITDEDECGMPSCTDHAFTTSFQDPSPYCSQIDECGMPSCFQDPLPCCSQIDSENADAPVLLVNAPPVNAPPDSMALSASELLHERRKWAADGSLDSCEVESDGAASEPVRTLYTPPCRPRASTDETTTAPSDRSPTSDLNQASLEDDSSRSLYDSEEIKSEPSLRTQLATAANKARRRLRTTERASLAANCFQELLVKGIEPPRKAVKKYLEINAHAADQVLGFKAEGSPPNPIFVRSVVAGSWAEKQGIKRGHMLRFLNGKHVSDLSKDDLRAAMRTRPLQMLLRQDDAEAPETCVIYNLHTVPVMKSLGQSDAKQKQVAWAESRRKIGKKNLTVFASTEVEVLGFSATGTPPHSVTVRSCITGSWAELQGIKAGDEMRSLNGIRVSRLSKEDLKVAMRTRPLLIAFRRRKREPVEQTCEIQDLATVHLMKQLARKQGGGDECKGATRKNEIVQADDCEDSSNAELELTASCEVQALGFAASGTPPKPVTVRSCVSGSWAEARGIKPGYKLKSLNGVEVSEMTKDELKATIWKRPLQMVFREGAAIAETCVIQNLNTIHLMKTCARPDAQVMQVDQNESRRNVGNNVLKVVASNDVESLGCSAYGESMEFVFISMVTPGSWAHQQGLAVGDRLIALNGKRIVDFASPAEVEHMTTYVRPLTMLVERKGSCRAQDSGLRSVACHTSEGADGARPKRTRLRTRRYLAAVEKFKQRRQEKASARRLSDAQERASWGERADDAYADAATNSASGKPMVSGLAAVCENGQPPLLVETSDIGGNGSSPFDPIGPLSLKVAGEEVQALGLKVSGSPPDPVVVRSCNSGSWAQVQGVKAGDVLRSLNSREISEMSKEEFRALMKIRPLALLFARQHSNVGEAALCTDQVAEKVSRRHSKRCSEPLQNRQPEMVLSIGTPGKNTLEVVASNTDVSLGFLASGETLESAVISKVTAGSWAQQHGIVPGDRLIAVDGKRVADFAWSAEIEELAAKRPVKMIFARCGGRCFGHELEECSTTGSDQGVASKKRSSSIRGRHKIWKTELIQAVKLKQNSLKQHHSGPLQSGMCCERIFFIAGEEAPSVRNPSN